MKEEQEVLVIDKDTALVHEGSANLMHAITRFLEQPNLDPEKMSRLLDVHERILHEQRKTAFMAAMARVTPLLPEIGKHGVSHHGAYSRLEDIDRVIRPIISKEGFSLSFDTLPVDTNKIRIILKVSHAAGHFETKQIDLPLDKSGNKQEVQGVASTIAYGRRLLTKMFFNLIEGGEDLDGNPAALIDQDQAREINTLLVDTKSDKAKFLKLIAGVSSIEEIPARDYKRVMTALQEKQRAQK